MRHSTQAVELLDPKLDLVFKLLLTREQRLLHSMLESVLDLPSPIESLEVCNDLRSATGDTLLDPKAIEFDVKVVLRSGEKSVVEMQARKHINYPERTLFYWARLYATDIHAGQSYSRLNRAYVISWVNAILFEGDAPHSRFHAFDRETQRQLSPHFEIHTIELPKLAKPSNALALIRLTQAKPELVRWARFLLAKTREELEILAQESPIMSTAKKTLEMISSEPEVQRLAYERETYLILQQDSDARSREEAETIGLAKGKIEGRAEGQRMTLQRLLERRFGSLSPSAIEQLDHASPEQLTCWTDAIFDAPTLEDLLQRT